MHLVKHRSVLKQRVHSSLIAHFGHGCPVSDLFGAQGRRLLERLEFPEPWRGNVLGAVALIDDLERQITAIERELKALGADHLERGAGGRNRSRSSSAGGELPRTVLFCTAPAG